MRLLYGLIALTPLLYGNPDQPSVVKGTASFEAKSPKHLAIHANDKTVIHWKDFSISAGEMAEFIQPSKQAAVLNRVVGGKASELLGSLKANGKVYLINTQGIVIGKDAVIHTAAFTASSLDLIDEDFIEGKELRYKGDSLAAVENYGNITAEEGCVFLIGCKVINAGVIESMQGAVGLGAGKEVLIRHDEGIFIRIPASEIKTEGSLYSLAVRSEGKIYAGGAEKKGGRVFLVAAEGKTDIAGAIEAEKVVIDCKLINIEETASIDASTADGGGSIRLGEKNSDTQFIGVHPGARLNASALDNGNGGEIILYAKGATFFRGHASAEGGPRGGDGGFIELSGKKFLDTKGKVSTAAPQGKMGRLLIDPANITITNMQQNNTATFSAIPPTETFTVDGLLTPCLIQAGPVGTAGTIEDFLVTSNVEVVVDATTFPGLTGEIGNITVSSPITWANSTSLSFFASGGITVSAAITNTSGGSPLQIPIFMRANYDIDINAPITVTGGVTGTVIDILTQLGTINVNAPVLADSGDIFLSTFFGTAKDLNLGASVGSYIGPGRTTLTANGNITIGITTAPFSPQNVEVFAASGDVSAQCNGDLNIIGQAQFLTGFHSQLGGNLDTLRSLGNLGTTITSTVTADVGGKLALSGGSQSGSYAQIGYSGGSAAPAAVTIDCSGNVNVFNGSIVLQGGTSTSCYAQIGLTPCTTQNTTLQSIGFTAEAGTVLILSGGSALDAYALVGLGGLASTGTTTYSGGGNSCQIFTGSPNTSLFGGSAKGAFAAIGVAGTPLAVFSDQIQVLPSSASAAPPIFNTISSAPIFTLQGGSNGSNAGAYAGIFLYGDLPMGNPGSIVSVPVHEVSLSSAGGGGGGTISVLGSTSFAAIGIGNSLSNNNDISAAVNISNSTGLLLSGNLIINGSSGSSFIQDGTGTPPSNPTLNITAIDSNNVFLISGGAMGGPAFINSVSQIQITAEANVSLTGTASFSSFIQAFDDIVIVTDDVAPSRPEIFFKGFSLDANSFLTITDGNAVSIYTARFPQNNIQGLINGASFTGTRFVNDSQNQYNTYFGDFVFANFPYTVFYKEGDSSPIPPHPGTTSGGVAIQEVTFLGFEFQPFKLPEENLYWEPGFLLAYDRGSTPHPLNKHPFAVLSGALKFWAKTITHPWVRQAYSSYIFAPDERFFVHKNKYIYYKGY